MAGPPIFLGTERRIFVGVVLLAAFLVDAAFVDLEPGATVTSSTSGR